LRAAVFLPKVAAQNVVDIGVGSLAKEVDILFTRHGATRIVAAWLKTDHIGTPNRLRANS
jgi:hypothetical protein